MVTPSQTCLLKVRIALGSTSLAWKRWTPMGGCLRNGTFLGVLLFAGMCLGPIATRACAQNDQSLGVEEAPLIDRPPFDVIVLTPAASGKRVPIAPLPTRDVSKRPSDATKLEVTLLSHEDRRYEIAWRDIERIELYEQMIYDEAVRKMGEKDFIGAFQNLSYLLRNYPQMADLEKLRRDFLFQSAAAMFADKKLFQTMSTLEELKSSAPNFETASVNNGLSRIVDTVIRSFVDNDDLLSAQQLLKRLEQQYGDTLPSVKTWNDELMRRADAQRAKAETLMKDGKYREARRAITSMIRIYPDAPGAKELLSEISRQHPMIRVGVMQRSKELDPSSLINWSARRSGSLVRRPLFEFLQTGTEGGKYGFALGTFRQSEDRQQLLLSIDPTVNQSVSPYEVAQLLLERATPGSKNYDASWAAIVKSVAVPNPQQILITLQRPHVLPHALLQFPPVSSQGDDLLKGVYGTGASDDVEDSYLLKLPTAGSLQPIEIVEHFYQDPKVAMNDLLRGEIDVLDQIYPSDAKRLSKSEKVRVGSYALPTVHMLLPISKNPYLAKDKFRRALLYATDRGAVLNGELLGGVDARDGRLISGPFPIGVDGNDPISYAYNNQVEPTPYDPRLAKLLLVMVDEEMKAAKEKFGQPIPPKTKLKLAVPDFELARVAAQALVQQWKLVGVEAETLPLAPGVTSVDELECDLVYVMASMWEPATDIERLLGASGPGASDNPFIVQGLTRLRDARNWREVRDSLQDLHRLVDYHLPILPLWQITDRFAYSKKLEGLAPGVVSLYQSVNQWQLDAPAPGNAAAQ